MTQPSLFPDAEKMVQKAREASSCRRAFKALREPFGTPDKRGKHPYEAFHEAVAKLPGEDRATLHRLILELPYDRFDDIRKLVNRWHGLHEYDRGDYQEAMG
jgi:hypothetical protein